MTTSLIPNRRLLVLACSAMKRQDPDYMPARLRYDGPLWRTLRSVDPDATRAKVAFLSAHYGFRDAETPIAYYDARLTPDLAERMIAGGMTTRWPRPRRRNGPDNAGMHPGTEIASMARYGREPFHDVALVGGSLYLEVMRAMLRGFQRMGCVLESASIATINGPIGRMRQDLRQWLLMTGDRKRNKRGDDQPVRRSCPSASRPSTTAARTCSTR